MHADPEFSLKSAAVDALVRRGVSPPRKQRQRIAAPWCLLGRRSSDGCGALHMASHLTNADADDGASGGALATLVRSPERFVVR